MAMNHWVDIGCLEDVPRRGARCITTPLGKIAVFRTADDKVFAIDDQCPHKGGPLSQGIVHGAQVTCPLHNWVFSLETGIAQGADERSSDLSAPRPTRPHPHRCAQLCRGQRRLKAPSLNKTSPFRSKIKWTTSPPLTSSRR
jgi:nitrite reductase (NADH) small subunit